MESLAHESYADFFVCARVEQKIFLIRKELADSPF